MPATYDSLATTTLGSANSTITFSSISGSYTDLRLILVGRAVTAGNTFTVSLTMNGDTATNYSRTLITGDGTNASSFRTTSASSIAISSPVAWLVSTNTNLYSLDFMSYAGSTNKTILISTSADQNGSGGLLNAVGLWRSTSAITSITLTSGDQFAAGATATLYGILRA